LSESATSDTVKME